MSELTSIVACEVMKLELEAVIGDRQVDLHYLDLGLHNTPKKMPATIQEKINEVVAAKKPDRLLLGYCLCSNGIAGVSGGPVSLTLPRCHDCIALLLGSNERYHKVFKENPGTYYLTAGWLQGEEDPLGCAENKYATRLGLEKAMRAMAMELANYTHICFINNGLGDIEKARARTKKNCRAFKKEYMELPGSLDYFRAFINGPSYPEKDFVTVQPGQEVDEEVFYDF